MSSPNATQPPQQSPLSQQQSLIPTQYRTLSRNNSNTSTASSSNKGDMSSTISITNSLASSRSQLSKAHQLIDHRHLLATCGGNSTPIRSFQRATISSVVKTRAFDNNPVLQGLLTATPSGQNSVSNSQTPSPHSTPIFSRSRSLRMSGGPNRYHQSPSHYPTTNRTPELNSFNSGDTNYSNESQAKLVELNNEKTELKENLEFLECERQVLIDSAKDLRQTLQVERSQWKKDHDDLKKQLSEAISNRIKAESQLTRNEVEMNDLRIQIQKLNEVLSSRDRSIEGLKKSLSSLQSEHQELVAINDELKHMLTEKLRYNGLTPNHNESSNQQVSECGSIVTEMARLRLELNEKEKLLEKFDTSTYSPSCHEMDNLNKFLDQTVECIKGWPEELASSSHVQNLMKTLLSAHKVDQNELALKNFHL